MAWVSTRPTQMGLETEDEGRQLEKELQVVTCTKRKHERGFHLLTGGKIMHHSI